MDNGSSLKDATPRRPRGHRSPRLHRRKKYGRISQVQVSKSLSADARNNWRDILSKWQVVLPQTANTARWTRTEEDATGEFVAQYSMTGATFPADIVKKKSRYLRLDSGGPSLAAAYKIQSSVHIHFDAYPRLIAGAEKVSFDGVQALGQTSSSGTFSFSLAGDPVAIKGRALAQIDLHKYEPTPWAAEFRDDENPPVADDGDFATNLLELRGLVKNGAYNTSDEIRVAKSIINLIQKTPGLTDKLLDELAAADTSKDLAAALLRHPRRRRHLCRPVRPLRRRDVGRLAARVPRNGAVCLFPNRRPGARGRNHSREPLSTRRRPRQHRPPRTRRRRRQSPRRPRALPSCQ